jgi:hypothetical protein
MLAAALVAAGWDAGGQELYPMRLPPVVPDEAAAGPSFSAGASYPGGPGYPAAQRYPIGTAVFSPGYDPADPYARPAAFDPPPGQPPVHYAAVPPEGAVADLHATIGTAHLPLDAAEHRCRILPEGVLWKAYLASPKESRMAAQFISIDGDSELFDATLGGRFALWRVGNGDPFFPEGFEFDVEGSAQVRLDLPEDVDVRSVDFRGGAFFAWGDRWRQTKLGYYHLSSHLGDEFLLKNPGYTRYNFARDVIVLGHSIYVAEDLRFYGEAGWAFWSDISEDWEFQFGAEYAPSRPTGLRGAPFLAVHGHLREELNYSGNLVFQAGWAWVGDESRNLVRIGLHYYNGASSQNSFYNEFEEQIGIGFWFDR